MDKKWKSNTCTRTSSKSQDILKDSYDNSYLHSKDSHGDQTYSNITVIPYQFNIDPLPNTNDAISFILRVTCNQSNHDELSPSSGNNNMTSDTIPMNIVRTLLE
jgi:hypothetical protein